MSDKSKKIVVDYALKKLQEAFTDLQNGKAPNFPQSLKSIKDILSEANKKVKDSTIKEEDFDKIVDGIAEQIVEKEQEEKKD
jgi:hypothetical protein